MRYRFVFTRWFDRNMRHLKRHNPQLRQDLEGFLQELDARAHPIIAGTGGARKARMKRSGRGKSGSYRVIYYLQVADTVWLLTFYDKIEKEELTPDEKADIRQLVKTIKENRSAEESE